MRIVLDLQACQASSMYRGIGRYSMALALAMARNSAGHELRIVLNEDYPDSVAAIRKAFDDLIPQSQITTFVTPVPTSEIDPRNAWRLRAAERIRAHYLATLRPDIVHVASLFEGLGDNSVISVPAHGVCYPTAVTLYDLIPLMRKERYLKDPNVAAWYHRKLDNLKNSEVLLAISDSARSEALDLLGLPADNVVNISSAVDSSFRPLSLSLERRAGLLAHHGLKREFIMYTGGIDYRKNIEGLVEAYAMLPSSLRCRYQLAVVCSVPDPDRVRLRRLASRLGLAEDDLVLTGFVPDDDLVALYNCTTLFVFPSLHEGFGLPALEAMACGAPVIGSNNSSIPEVIGRADALFDPTNSRVICASMAAVLSDPGRQSELRSHGLKQARRFSWDASAKRAIVAFEETVRRSPRRAVVLATCEKPAKLRLALVSTRLPPSTMTGDKTNLLSDFATHYDVELVLVGDGASAAAPDAPFPTRSASWFDAHAHTFDRVLYRFDDGADRAAMSGLLARHAGIVILADTLPCTVAHTGPSVKDLHALYLSYGYAALIRSQEHVTNVPISVLSCDPQAFCRATGVIAHSARIVTDAERWYGAGVAKDWLILGADACQEGTSTAASLRDAIEAIERTSLRGAEQRLIEAIGADGADAALSDLLQAAAAIAGNRPRGGPNQILIDIAGLASPSGHERLRELLARPPAGWRIEPVYQDGERYRFARRFTLDLIGCIALPLADAVVEAKSGDMLVTLNEDSREEHPPSLPPSWRARGVHHRRLATGMLDEAALTSGNLE